MLGNLSTSTRNCDRFKARWIYTSIIGAEAIQRFSDTETPCKHWGKYPFDTTFTHTIPHSEKVKKNIT